MFLRFPFCGFLFVFDVFVFAPFVVFPSVGLPSAFPALCSPVVSRAFPPQQLLDLEVVVSSSAAGLADIFLNVFESFLTFDSQLKNF